MERANVVRIIPYAVAAIYIATGDYASFMRYLKIII
jgi:hypothetical protein